MVLRLGMGDVCMNTTELLESPFNTMFSPYTDLMGSFFWLLPVLIIAGALFVKTKNITSVGVWLLGAGMFMGGMNLFGGFPIMLDLFGALIIIGIIMVVVPVVLREKGG